MGLTIAVLLVQSNLDIHRFRQKPRRYLFLRERVPWARLKYVRRNGGRHIYLGVGQCCSKLVLCGCAMYRVIQNVFGFRFSYSPISRKVNRIDTILKITSFVNYILHFIPIDRCTVKERRGNASAIWGLARL